ncbi:hypothetical protein LZ30DRAFT_75089 [Colletotrichum cereale]|nr:hypothetical protein LZ30DRAFT_75089 [Colletotrichum cereale]
MHGKPKVSRLPEVRGTRFARRPCGRRSLVRRQHSPDLQDGSGRASSRCEGKRDPLAGTTTLVGSACASLRALPSSETEQSIYQDQHLALSNRRAKRILENLERPGCHASGTKPRRFHVSPFPRLISAPPAPNFFHERQTPPANQRTGGGGARLVEYQTIQNAPTSGSRELEPKPKPEMSGAIVLAA